MAVSELLSTQLLRGIHSLKEDKWSLDTRQRQHVMTCHHLCITPRSEAPTANARGKQGPSYRERGTNDLRKPGCLQAGSSLLHSLDGRQQATLASVGTLPSALPSTPLHVSARKWCWKKPEEKEAVGTLCSPGIFPVRM